MARKRQPGWQTYKEQMDFLGLGEALWEPAPAHDTRIRIGDVGFIRRGQFHLLFCAASVLGNGELGVDFPSSFHPLDIGETVSGAPRPPGCLRTDTVRETGIGVSAAPAPQLDTYFSFKLTGKRGAALVTKYPTYWEDSPLEGTFENYTLRHYKSWVTFAREKGYGDVQPVLISGFDATKDFAMVGYSNEGDRTFESNYLVINVPFWGRWHAKCPPHTNYGPIQRDSPRGLPSHQPEGTGSIPNEFNQYVFIRYYTVRRIRWIPMLSEVHRIGGGQHGSGSGGNTRDTFMGQIDNVRSGAEPPTTSDNPGGRLGPIDDTPSETDTAVGSINRDEERDAWDAIVDYISQNSDAVSVSTNRDDLARVLQGKDTDDPRTFLAKQRPRIVVDASGVGRISDFHQPVGNTTPNPEPHPVATTVLNTGVGVNQHVRSPGDAEPPTPGPIVTARTSKADSPVLAESLLLGVNPGLVEDVARPAPISHSSAGETAVGDGDTPALLPSSRLDTPQHTNDPLGPSTAIDSYEQAWQRLISRTVPQDELPSLIETIFSDRRRTDMVDRLQVGDAQAFVDMIDGVLDKLNLTPPVRKNCVNSLYKTCARHSVLPRSVQIAARYNSASPPHSHGGFADVWKGEYRGLEVAVKVLRISDRSDLKVVARRFYKEFVTWKALDHPNVLPLLGVMIGGRFAMVSGWMANGNINQFVATHRDANRFELLGDVARGLVYMHSQGMVHGDLKGANILVDQTRHARLADFGLLSILPNSATSNSCTQGGTIRWMSPELLELEIQGQRRTEPSDCYALGMVIYEVLSGHAPFHQYLDQAVTLKVQRGERPERPQGAKGNWFTDDVWKILESCWQPKPDDRPRTRDIFQSWECLEAVSELWTPPSPTAGSPQSVDWSLSGESLAAE